MRTASAEVGLPALLLLLHAPAPHGFHPGGASSGGGSGSRAAQACVRQHCVAPSLQLRQCSAAAATRGAHLSSATSTLHGLALRRESGGERHSLVLSSGLCMMSMPPPPGLVAAVRSMLGGALQSGRGAIGGVLRAAWVELEGWVAAGLEPLAAWLEGLVVSNALLLELRIALRGGLLGLLRFTIVEVAEGLLLLVQGWNAVVRMEVARLAVAATAASRSLLLLLLAPLHTRRVGLLFCCAVAFALSWAVATISLGRLTDAYNAKQAKGLYLRSRAEHHRCPHCMGFGIEPCDLCKSTGFRVYEMKFIYTDPCPKCFARRWQWCHRCGGSGSRAEPWTAWAMPRIIYTLFPG